MDIIGNANSTLRLNTDVVSLYYQLYEDRDRRTEEWPMLFSEWGAASPAIPILIVGMYVILVTIIGPMMMKNRKPYSLKNALLIYNFMQVIFSCCLVYFSVLGGRHYNFVCQDVERHTKAGSTGMYMAVAAWGYYINKYIEFLDTIFFVLRKKWNQVTFLHVYHHGIMPIYIYIGARWLPGGHESFAALVNSVVHVVMYSYYFLAAVGVSQKYLWWKRYITIFQLVQFVILFGHSLVFLIGYGLGFQYAYCGYPWQYSALGVTILYIPFFIMFLKFYIASYSIITSKKNA